MTRTAQIHWLNSPVAYSLAHGLQLRGFQVRGVREPGCTTNESGGLLRVDEVEGASYDAWLDGNSAELEVDLLIVAPLLPTLSDWVRASSLARDLEETIERSFALLRASGRALMRRRSGQVIVIPPQRVESGQLAPAEQRCLEAKQAMLAQGLYALTKVFALELASRGIRAQFVDLTGADSAEGALELIDWLTAGAATYTTGQRFDARLRAGESR